MSYIQKTQSAYNGLIDKPILTTELLSKPPFKFIFDIVQNVQNKSGIFKTIEESAWNVSSYVDKASKASFIDEIIKAVDDGTLSHIKSVKILSGKHPELANELLQRIAHVATKSEKKKAKKKSESPKPKKEKAASSKKSKEKEEDAAKSSSVGTSSKDKEEKKKKKKQKSSEISKRDKQEKKQQESDSGLDLNAEKRLDEQENLMNTEQLEVPSEMHAEDQPSQEFIRPSVEPARPRTAARPAPPALKKKQISTIRTSQEPPVAEVPIFNETTTLVENDESAFEIRDADINENEDVPRTDDGAGVLVQKIMENKAELDVKETNENEKKQETHFGDEIQVSNLQAEIQKITRQAYPVVQILEFVQEDIEAMMRELEKWRAETRENDQRLKDLIAQEFTDISRLSNKLSALDREIKAEVSEISFLKCRVLSNDLMIKERIFRE